MAVCGTGISSISSTNGISGVILPPAQVIVEKLAEQVEFSHLSQTLRERINTITDLQNGLTQVNSTVANETGILAQELQALRNDMTNAVAYINTQTNVSITERQSMVNSINTLMAQWGNRIAALEESSSVTSTDIGFLQAEKFVKADLNGNVVGYGLSAQIDPQGHFSSDFQVRADTFSIAGASISSATAPANPYNGKVWVNTSVTPNITKWYNGTTKAWQTTPVKGAVPFIVKTSPETKDGVTINPGVYIDSAYISQLSADKIDTRGLSIRDSTGNIILAAGNALDWSNVGGTGKPADGATKNQIFRQSTQPTGSSTGDLWVNTGASPVTVSQWTGTEWSFIGNYTTNTSQLTDGAGLGTKAIWANVTGTNRPADNATVGAPAGTYVGNTLAETVASGASNGTAALSTINDSTTGLNTKIANNARNIFSGSGGLAVGSITWDSVGNYSNGSGIAITSKGIAAVNAGVAKFYLDTAGNAAFAGTLSAAAGTFSGTLTADAINAVNTINIAGNAVTVPIACSGGVGSRFPSNGVTTATVGGGSQITLGLFESAAMTFTDSSGAVSVVFSAQCSTENYGGGCRCGVIARLVNTATGSTVGTFFNQWTSISGGWTVILSATGKVNIPAAGTYKVVFDMGNNWSAGGWELVSNAGAIVMGVKR